MIICLRVGVHDTQHIKVGLPSGVVGGIVVALLLALCLWFVCRRKRNKQVGEKRVAAKKEKQQKQKKQPSGSMLGFLRRRKKGDSAVGTGMSHVSLHPCVSCLCLRERYCMCCQPVSSMSCTSL